MKYDVVIKATLTPSDEVDADTDVLGDALLEELDNTDLDVFIESDDEDEDGQDVSYRFAIDDVELTEVKEG